MPSASCDSPSSTARREAGFRYATGFYCGPPAAASPSSAAATVVGSVPGRLGAKSGKSAKAKVKGSPDVLPCNRHDWGISPSSTSGLGRAYRSLDSPRSSRFGQGSSTADRPEDRSLRSQHVPSLQKSVGSTTSSTPKRLIRHSYSASAPSLQGRSKEHLEEERNRQLLARLGSAYTAEQWAFATSYERLEGLRQRLRRAREEKELVLSSLKSDELARRRALAELEANRKILVKLRAEEQSFHDNENAQPSISTEDRKVADLERRVAAKRAAVASLAEVVAESAKSHVAASQLWKDLVSGADCARALAALPAARKEADDLLEQERSAHRDLTDAEAQAQAVREKCRLIRQELSDFRSSLETADERAESLAWNVEGARSELAQEKCRRNESQKLLEEEETQLGELRRRVETRAEECAAAKTVTRRLACQFRQAEEWFQDVSPDGAETSTNHHTLLEGLRRRAGAAAAQRQQAEAELKAQRSASRSWLKTVEVLHAGQSAFVGTNDVARTLHCPLLSCKASTDTFWSPAQAGHAKSQHAV